MKCQASQWQVLSPDRNDGAPGARCWKSRDVNALHSWSPFNADELTRRLDEEEAISRQFKGSGDDLSSRVVALLVVLGGRFRKEEWGIGLWGLRAAAGREDELLVCEKSANSKEGGKRLPEGRTLSTAHIAGEIAEEVKIVSLALPGIVQV